VNQATSVTTLTSSSNPGVLGQSVTFTATISAVFPGAGTPSGTVTFRDGSTLLGTAMLANGTGTFTTSSLTQSSHALTVSYASDGNFTNSTSATLTQMVNQAASTITATAPPTLS